MAGVEGLGVANLSLPRGEFAHSRGSNVLGSGTARVKAGRAVRDVGFGIVVGGVGVQAPWDEIRQDGERFPNLLRLKSILENLHLDLA